MRLSKKIAAVALAAVMSVSLLTACGGTDAPSSSNPGSSSSSSSSSSADSSSSSGSASDSSSASSSSGSSSNSSTDDKEENVDYKNSRTARFFKKLGTNYTMGWKVTFTEEGANETANILISTNGNRAYEKVTELSNDGDVENAIVLIDQAKRQGWLLVPDESLKEDGKLGYYRAVDVSGIQIENKFVIKPADGIKFTQKTKGNYYIETQTFEQTVEEQTIKMVMSYCYVGNDSVPKYVEVKVSSGGKEATTHMEITSIEYKANTKYLDFETILKQYVNISDMLGAASMPSVAGLTIG